LVGVEELRLGGGMFGKLAKGWDEGIPDSIDDGTLDSILEGIVGRMLED